jgi:uncharacterized protein (TIGR03089 family)
MTPPSRQPATFAELLSDLLRRDPGRPLITFYDDATGERVELSVTTYANWVAKTASLLAEEFDVERGSRVLIDLPIHWLVPVFLGAAWTIGAEVVEEQDVDLVITGPAPTRLETYAAGSTPVLACALLPLGVRFRDALPSGVHDFGLEVWSQPDAFTPWDLPEAGDALFQGATWGDLPRSGPWSGERLLTTVNPLADPAVLLQPVAGGGSVVLWRNADGDPARLDRLRDSERVTATHLVAPEA